MARQLQWLHTPIFSSVAAATTTGFELSTQLPTVREGFTLTRTIFRFRMEPDGAAGEDAVPVVSAGITFWPVEAITTFPDPEVETEEADWLWRESFQRAWKTQSVTIGLDAFIPGVEFKEDLHGQRRISHASERPYLIVVQSAGTGVISGYVRQLWRHP